MSIDKNKKKININESKSIADAKDGMENSKECKLLSFKKRLILKSDGRHIIYYDFKE